MYNPVVRNEPQLKRTQFFSRNTQQCATIGGVVVITNPRQRQQQVLQKRTEDPGAWHAG